MSTPVTAFGIGAPMEQGEVIEDYQVEERMVTYHIEVAGKLVLVENVPARVNIEALVRGFIRPRL